MAVKKRVSARQKVAKSLQKNDSQQTTRRDTNISSLGDFDENPLLKLAKITKKEKSKLKTTAFTKHITKSSTGGISKSSLRRQKRKAKNELNSKISDLLDTLPDSVNVKDVKKTSESIYFINSDKEKLNAPNITKNSGYARVLSEENKNFKDVLRNKEFRSSPFSALKAVISQNLKK